MLNDEAIKAFRKALGTYVTGVTVLTTLDEHRKPRGLTANSFTSVSLSPPLVLICVAKSSSSLAAFTHSGVFGVNVLSHAQKPISNTFASKQAEKFNDVKWHAGQTGVPLLDDALAHFECLTVNQVDAGDHIIFIGHVQAFGRTSAAPLAYGDGQYVEVQPAGGSSQGTQQTRVGALLECGGCILFTRSGDGKLHLPTAPRLGPEADASSLLGYLRGQPVDARIERVYSVFDHRDGAREVLSIYYIGVAFEKPQQNSGLVAIPVEAIAPADIADVNERFILSRFLQERAQGFYGLYSGVTGMPAQVHKFAEAA